MILVNLLEKQIIMESKNCSDSDFATNSTLAIAENKMPDDSNLVKKADYDAKKSDIENEYITTSDYN